MGYARAAMFRRSRWLLVVLAILVIGAVELVSDSLLDPIVPFPGDTLLVMAVIAGVGLAGVTIAFRSIDRLAAELRERNAELEASNATTRALHRVSLALATLSHLDAILDTVVASARDLLDADVALLVLARSHGPSRSRLPAARMGHSTGKAYSPAPTSVVSSTVT